MNATAAKPMSTPERTIHVVQGDFRIVHETDVVLSTILGSCVAACIRDPVAGIGGMNHFLLPGEDQRNGEQQKYGVHAMELLINELLKAGASRRRLEAKVFGGAHVVHQLGDIGIKNAEFVTRFLSAERIPCVGQSLGGSQARRVRYWPTSGRAIQLLLDARDVFTQERRNSTTLPPAPSSDVELF